MLPAVYHPLSPAATPSPSSPPLPPSLHDLATPLSTTSSVTERDAHPRPPLFDDVQNGATASEAQEGATQAEGYAPPEGYFAQSLRRARPPAPAFLSRQTTLRPAPVLAFPTQFPSHAAEAHSPPSPVAAVLAPPRFVSFPAPPHHFAAQARLVALPHAELLDLTRALSKELEEAKVELGKREREIDALEMVAREGGVGSGEVQRTRVRARVVSQTEHARGEEPVEWRIVLLPVEAEMLVDQPVDSQTEETERVETETALDLDDLAEAISENAFDFTSQADEASLAARTISDSDDEAADRDDMDGTTGDDRSIASSTRYSRDTPTKESAQRSRETASDPPGRVRRERHTSLTARLFGSFSVSPPAPAGPASVHSSTSASSAFVTSPLHPKPTSPSLAKTRDGRAESITSVSSAASTTSLSSEVSGKGKPRGEGGTGDWLGWRSWARAPPKESGTDGKGRVPAAAGDGVSHEGATTPNGERPSPSLLGRTLSRTRGDADAAITSSNAVAPSLIADDQPAPPEDRASSYAPSVASRTTAAPSSPEVTSSPTTSTSPPSPSSMSESKPTLHTLDVRPTGLVPLVRPRGPSNPLLTPQHLAASPTLSTPTPTSTFSAPHHLSVNRSRKASSSRSAKLSASATAERIVHPSHFTAVAAAAGRWISTGADAAGSTVFYRSERVHERIRQLVDGLLGNVAAGAPTRAAQHQADDEEDRTLKAGRSDPTTSRAMPPPFLSVAVPLHSADSPLSPAQPRTREKGYVSTAKGTIGRALGLGAAAGYSMMRSTSASSALATTAAVVTADGARRRSLTTSSPEPNVTMFPKLATLSRYSPSPARAQASYPNGSTTASSPIPKGGAAATMELDTISAEAPPTLAIHHPRNGRPLTGVGDEGPLVDRYGFVYDVSSGMELLKESRRRKEMDHAGDGANGSRGGINGDGQEGDEEAAGVDEAVLAQADVEAEMDALREALGLPPSSAASSPSHARFPLPRLGKVAEETDGADSSSAPPLGSSAAAVPPAGAPLPVAHSKPLRPARLDTMDTRPLPHGAQSMKRLLGQLTSMHDAADKTQKEVWDVFITRRQATLAKPADGAPMRREKSRPLSLNVATSLGASFSDVASSREEDARWNENLVGVAQMGVAGKAGKDDWQEFKDLVRQGVPIAYRPKIWAECSGANEAREPGLYHELLDQHRGEDNLCIQQIDMDCHRTFPTNVFFAGNGPGVAKLRNVLIAFSWRNPKIGYCQGMNLLTGTLLLTYPSEEDAFWVLVCLIEKILPSDYYTSHLLVSQADQRVLRDLVQRILPDVADHLDDLGVELPAVTFSWFLSLFTDALPIQVGLTLLLTACSSG